jgi:hypothetical protein
MSQERLSAAERAAPCNVHLYMDDDGAYVASCLAHGWRSVRRSRRSRAQDLAEHQRDAAR